MNIGVVGNGVVGKHLVTDFTRAGVEVLVYDRYDPSLSGERHKRAINACGLVFIAVPTPSGTQGECDLTEVREAVSWISPPICLKSTVAPGTTDRLIQEFGKRIVFSPEYIGETVYHRSALGASPDLVAVGGERELCDLVLSLYAQVYGPLPFYSQTDAITAELGKYMENCYLATKVAFVAQFYLLAQAFGANFTQMREMWLADPRVGRSHSTVTGELGFGGKCLPKDLAALICEARKIGHSASFLEGVQDFNSNTRGPAARSHSESARCKVDSQEMV